MSEIEDNMNAVTRATGNSYEKLLTDLKIDLLKLEPPLSPQCCIYRVSSNLRRVNEEAYTPDFVSIGPLHYCDENLKKMEKHKLRYLERFLKRAEGRGKRLEDFVRFVKENEKTVRCRYAETFDLDSDQFARMILVDASFIIELFLRWFPGTSSIAEMVERRELIFDHPSLAASLFWKDLVLLENQLPFFVLEDLFRMVHEDRSFSHISHHLFWHFNNQKKSMPKSFQHFTDLVRNYQLPEVVGEKEPREAKEIGNKGNVDYLYSVTELHEAGVKFKVSSSGCLFDVKFTESTGVLEMPCFTVHDQTEVTVRNIMALEQYLYPWESHVSDYFILMDCLINTDKDVELLVQNKILVNQLGSNKAVASFVNKLAIEILHDDETSRHVHTIKKLNAYYEAPHHKWIAALRNIYFKTPWRGASTIAAIILLLLTLAQTISSFIPN